MHTIYSTRYQSPERCMELSRYVKAQIILDYLSIYISNKVKKNQEILKKVKKNPNRLEAIR